MSILKDRPLIIAGSGRSGTTWVLDVLAESNKLLPIFEPLNPLAVKEARNFCSRYIRSNALEPELENFMIKTFNGELNYSWLKTRIAPTKMRPSFTKIFSWDYNYTLLALYKKFTTRYFNYVRKRSFRPIIKFIRANLMLEWLAENFDPRIIFIVRHPGAVVASKIAASKTRGGAEWDFYGPYQQSVFYQYKKDKDLRKDYLGKYSDILTEKLSPVGGHTLVWCIENILPIYNKQKRKYYAFYYEDILMNPEREFDRMVRILGLERKPDISIIASPSQQASSEMRSCSFSENQLTRWMKSFTRKELCEIDIVLKFFKVTTYNAFEPMPISRTQDFI